MVEERGDVKALAAPDVADRSRGPVSRQLGEDALVIRWRRSRLLARASGVSGRYGSTNRQTSGE
jgi:hypothetical protein